MGEFGSCRSCRAQVYWCRSAASKKPMPLEENADGGNVLIDEAGLAHAFRDNEAARIAQRVGWGGDGVEHEFGEAVYISHHATCPQGDRWRGKTRDDADAPPAQPDEEALF